jgi:hypothetical protein
MSTNDKLYRASMGKETSIKELESMIASNGALIHRVEQRERETVVFFSGRDESVERCHEALSQYGKVALNPVSAEELLRIP